MATEGNFPKSDGDIFFASEANLLQGIQQLYTGAGFDSINPNTEDHELTAITASTIGVADYLIIEATVLGFTSANGTTTSDASIKYQVKETGGAYGDVMAFTKISESDTPAAHIFSDSTTTTVKWVHTLTAGQKTNGVQVKVFSKSNETGAGTASVTNIQTTLTLAK